MGALLAAVQVRVALGTGSREVDSRRQCCRATVTPRSRHRLNQTRQARTRHVEWRPWSGRSRPVFTAAPRFPVGIHVARLSVLSVAVHEASTYSLRFWVVGLSKIGLQRSRALRCTPQSTLGCRRDSAGRPRRRKRSTLASAQCCKYILTTNTLVLHTLITRLFNKSTDIG
jgi:hypothetical protein